MRATPLLAVLLAACTTPDTLVMNESRAAEEYAIAPYEFHEECATMAPGDRIDYRFDAQAPVDFQVFYQEGAAYISTVNREGVREAAGVFTAPAARRYCVRWDAGAQGALVDYKLRLLPPRR